MELPRIILFNILLLLVQIDSIFSDTTKATETPIKSTTKETLCTKCSCTLDNLEHIFYNVDCRLRGLKKIPLISEMPHKTRYLNLGMNNITKLDKFEPIEELVSLYLTSNGIKEIDNLAFEHLTNLNVLDLSYNELKTIPSTLFEGLGELTNLNLSYNKIEHLPLDLFQKTGILFELNLEGNQIKYLSPDLFSNLYDLEILNLAKNDFASLPSGFFHRLHKLTNLDLSSNCFESVPTNALQICRHLKILDLSDNPIRILKEGSFSNIKSLMELHLNRMPKLIRIEKYTFSSLTNLINLQINDNRHLSIINEFAFKGMFDRKNLKIKNVELRNNQLKKLSETALPFCNLTNLDLRENPWECNCHVHWMIYCHGPSEYERDILCAGPENLAGHELVQIPQKDLVCHNHLHRTTHYLFLFSMFFTTGLFITILMLIFRDKLTAFYGRRKRVDGSIYYIPAQSNNNNNSNNINLLMD